ncbi:PoNe immunity protein domain-containing protein [Janthinobacterium sp.]|uniref:PoNe immunity protein domain-containing protein n=1 Tax=Janthinobacterium sp. TaxID=1871054 RepID=UPI00293D5AB5|nr:PoNe immunity protein domain-containing protein [Janthinobacterium sp.]
MNFLELLFQDATGRLNTTEHERGAMYDWLKGCRIDNPAAGEGGVMAGIPGNDWYRLPEPVTVGGQRTDLVVGNMIGSYFVFAGQHAALFAAELDLQYDADNKMDRPQGLDSLLAVYELDADGEMSELEEGGAAPSAASDTDLPRHFDDVYFRVTDLSDAGRIETRTTIAWQSSSFTGFTLLGTTFFGYGSQLENPEMRQHLTVMAADWALRKECAAQAQAGLAAAWPYAPRQRIVDMASYQREIAYVVSLARGYELRRDKGYRFHTDDPFWIYAACDMRFREFSLKYTAGLPCAELERPLELAVGAYEKARVALTLEYGQGELSALNFDDLQEYARCMQLAGACILLGRSDLVARVAAMQDHEYRGEDAFFEGLLQFELADRVDDVDEWYYDVPYTHLVDCFEEDEDGRPDCLARFLRAWHPALVSGTWYNGHLRANGPGGYFGLWAFEAAALAYLMDIDDSGIMHWAYPADLVAHARQRLPRRRA